MDLTIRFVSTSGVNSSNEHTAWAWRQEHPPNRRRELDASAKSGGRLGPRDVAPVQPAPEDMARTGRENAREEVGRIGRAQGHPRRRSALPPGGPTRRAGGNRGCGLGCFTGYPRRAWTAASAWAGRSNQYSRQERGDLCPDDALEPLVVRTADEVGGRRVPRRGKEAVADAEARAEVTVGPDPVVQEPRRPTTRSTSALGRAISPEVVAETGPPRTPARA